MQLAWIALIGISSAVVVGLFGGLLLMIKQRYRPDETPENSVQATIEVRPVAGTKRRPLDWQGPLLLGGSPFATDGFNIVNCI